ncbi:hypothetical protein MOUN0_N03180 [Monosporozyma unispora]|nr:hypothetical protein C6P44_004700 [Kazachstania unispora]
MTSFDKKYFTDVKPLQTGSFSTVYKAWSIKLNEYVALKVISKEKSSKDIILNEVEVMKTLGDSHPNICHMLDFYEDEFNYVLVLEYCEYGDLYDFLDIAKRQGEPTAPSLIQLDFQTMIKQLFSALYYAHSLGIAHRDIKPENILMTKDGDIKLADWGHATFQKTSTEFHIGTDNYRAPETFYHEGGYDTINSDYWSLGVTILFLIFGQCAFKSAAIDLNTIPQKYNKNIKLCPNFQDYLKDSHQFIYEFFLAPIFAANNQQSYSYHNSKPALYVWQDLVNIYYVIFFCRIIVDTLINVDVNSRSFFKCLELCDEFWSIYQQQASPASNDSIQPQSQQPITQSDAQEYMETPQSPSQSIISMDNDESACSLTMASSPNSITMNNNNNSTPVPSDSFLDEGKVIYNNYSIGSLINFNYNANNNSNISFDDMNSFSYSNITLTPPSTNTSSTIQYAPFYGKLI